jgi:hypothetical protein
MSFHGWQSALGGRRVLLSEDVIADLRMLAIEGFTALRRRGLEVGGILVGDPGGDELRIVGFQESPCEHRYGPSYALSESDREKLTELLSLRRKAAPPVVGFYRSVTGREPAIEESDEALVAQCFPSGEGVFLLLCPLSAENCVATLRFFRDGQFLPGPEEQTIPFGQAGLPAITPGSRKAGAVPDSDPVPATEAVKEKIAPTPAWVAEPAPRRSTWWKTALVCLGSAVAGASIFEMGWSQNPTQPAPPRFAELRLDARPDGGNLLVSWDGAMAKSLRATHGALTIADGGSQREVELGAAEVQTGRHMYPAEHPDVAIRLTLSANGGMVASESVRLAATPVLAPPSSVPAPAAPPSVAESAEAAVPPEAVREVRPTIPAGIRSRIEGQIVIPVDVRVSDHGRVIGARAANVGNDGVHRYLAEQAERAARGWQFRPARTRTGAAVASNRTISFVFMP